MKGTGSDTFTPAPEGVHQGVCIDVVDKGIITTEWNGRKREVPKVVIRWALDVEREDGQFFKESALRADTEPEPVASGCLESKHRSALR